MVYLRRVLIAVLSAGWVWELTFAFNGVAGYIALPPTTINSFPMVDFARDGFTRGVVWLALVVVYWTWRYRRRLWWLVAILSVAGLAPALYSGRAYFESVKAVFGNGMRPSTPLADGGVLVANAGSQVLTAFTWWLVVMLAFWAWRLSAPSRPRVESA